MFSIHFTDIVMERYQTGEIIIGSFGERFEASLWYWDAKQYESHWREQVARIVRGAPRGALVTSMVDPLDANFITLWPMYRDGHIVRFQQRLLFLDQLPQKFDENDIPSAIGPRVVIDEDGQTISEWETSVADMAGFLDS